jgi:hypothetical protein
MNKTSGDITLTPEQSAVKATVNTCLKQTVEEGVIYISNRGGYYKLSEEIVNYEEIAYHYYDGQIVMPTIETIQEQLTMYINDNLPVCLTTPELFIGKEVKFGNIETITIIYPKNIEINVNYPITFSNADEKFILDNFNYKLGVRLGEIHTFLTDYMNNYQLEHPLDIVLSQFEEFVQTNDYYYYTVKEGSDMIFSIEDQTTTINEKTYMFFFVNNYDWKLEEVETNETE